MNGLRRLGPVIAVGLLLAAAMVVSGLSTPQVTHLPQVHGSASPQVPTRDAGDVPTYHPSTTQPYQEQGRVTFPGWLVDLVTLLFLAVLLVAIGAVVWYLVGKGRGIRIRKVPGGEVRTVQEQRDAVLAAVDAGLEDLDDDDADPRRAVIACWVRLEEAATAAGIERGIGDSPADLVTRLLMEHRVSAPILLALADVYRIARYATHTVDETMRQQARAALRQLRAELTRAPAEAAP